ncbi:sodium/proton antiporter, NhaA family [Filimonas lacunae]|uniref:Na(+)/H(+) antiporter NhaA n=1 Tax=Filimonas lacunae TaxID=477680 RepID=A0A173ME47_9BACT|nr:Na+/H+ antiporter NhaA [Filimonas lacunae]BAV05872.1 Na+/H+ antiporter NhaA type [Filimonas lacunae]SIT34586.1 sodium/proton antiporter, NhaA family [Filimonas lacunae]
MKWLPSVINSRWIDPLKALLNDSRSIGIILLLCTILSLLVANTADGASWLQFWQTPFHQLEKLYLPHTLLHWLNDGGMTLFFLLAGMEIKSELVGGELSTFKKALLPIVAAIGGMLMPALIYTICNFGTVYAQGWGIPTATDIAFSLGIASLLGRKLPSSLKIFLTALAIIDDLGAIVVIALFYGGKLQLAWLLAVLVLIVALYFLFKRYQHPGWIHYLLGILLWYCLLNTGIHATVAGVVFAFFIPASHLHSLQQRLHKSVYFVILPAFALANTAITFPEQMSIVITSSLSWGIMLGLFIGKPLGISLACFLVVRLGYAQLPSLVKWKHMIGAGLLAGIGFTMSIFISTLAFGEQSTQDIAKISVLLVSSISMLCGFLWLKAACRQSTLRKTL